MRKRDVAKSSTISNIELAPFWRRGACRGARSGLRAARVFENVARSGAMPLCALFTLVASVAGSRLASIALAEVQPLAADLHGLGGAIRPQAYAFAAALDDASHRCSMSALGHGSGALRNAAAKPA